MGLVSGRPLECDSTRVNYQKPALVQARASSATHRRLDAGRGHLPKGSAGGLARTADSIVRTRFARVAPVSPSVRVSGPVSPLPPHVLFWCRTRQASRAAQTPNR